MVNITDAGSLDASGVYQSPKRAGLGHDPVISRAQALRSLPPVVYFMRMPDGIIKIGHSSSLNYRVHALRGRLLGFVPGTREDETRHHQRVRHLLHHGREWFSPGPDLCEYINQVRAELGLPAA